MSAPFYFAKTPDDTLALNQANDLIGRKVDHEGACHLLYQLALKGIGSVESNPLVGALLVGEDHKILAVGSHLKSGQGHAEKNLYDSIAQKIDAKTMRQATLYISLEPCCFRNKRTPPCTDLILKDPPKKVFYALRDPHESVNGKGIELLEKNNIPCEKIEHDHLSFSFLIERFATNTLQKRPFIGLKAGLSLDGSIGSNLEGIQWQTSKRSRQYAHFLRAVYDGIVIGVDTFLKDNPCLNIRLDGLEKKEPVKIVLDPNARGLVEFHQSNLFKNNKTKIYWVVDESKKINTTFINENDTIELIKCPLLDNQNDHNKFDLNYLVSTLFEKKIHSLLLEGGRSIWGEFFNQSLVDKMHIFQSPFILNNDQSLFWHEKIAPKKYQVLSQKITLLNDDILREINIRFKN